MIFNNENVDIGKVIANKYFINVESVDSNTIFYLNFNNENFDIKNMDLNNKLRINDYTLPEVSLKIDLGTFLFYRDFDVYLTKLEENLYKLELNVEKPDVIHFYSDKIVEFYNLSINVDFAFDFDYIPEVDRSILEKSGTKYSHDDLLNVLNKL